MNWLIILALFLAMWVILIVAFCWGLDGDW